MGAVLCTTPEYMESPMYSHDLIIGEEERPSEAQKSSTFIGNLRKSITLKRPSSKNSKNKVAANFIRSRSANEAASDPIKEVDAGESRSPSTTTASSNFFTRGVSNTFSMIWKPRGAVSEKKMSKQPSAVQGDLSRHAPSYDL